MGHASPVLTPPAPCMDDERGTHVRPPLRAARFGQMPDDCGSEAGRSGGGRRSSSVPGRQEYQAARARRGLARPQPGEPPRSPGKAGRVLSGGPGEGVCRMTTPRAGSVRPEQRSCLGSRSCGSPWAGVRTLRCQVFDQTLVGVGLTERRRWTVAPVEQQPEEDQECVVSIQGGPRLIRTRARKQRGGSGERGQAACNEAVWRGADARSRVDDGKWGRRPEDVPGEQPGAGD